MTKKHFWLSLLILILSIPLTIEADAISENTVLPSVIERDNASNESNFSFEVNQTNIENITKQLTEYGERRINKENTSLAADYIKNAMSERGLAASLEEFSFEAQSKNKRWNATGINIVGIKDGSILKDQIILVTAHYDSIGGPGADDNAAGVASMLEVAGSLQNDSFNRTVYFIAFSGEEDGFLGSKAWISEHKDLSEKIVGVINVDYVGKKNLNVGYLPQYSWLKDILNESAENLKISVSIGAGTPSGGSDQVPFWENHIPAVIITHHATDTYIHTENDTIDKVDFSAVRDATSIITQSVYYLASTSDGVPPSVSITHLEKKSNTCAFNLTYNVSDRNSIIELFLDNASMGYIKSGQRFTFTKGNHTIKVSATDMIGNTGSDSTTFTCTETYTSSITNSSSYVPTDIISHPWKKDNNKTASYVDNFIRLEYNCTSNNTTIFLDGIGIGSIESGHMFILNPGIHTFEVYNENDNGSINSDSVTFETGASNPFGVFLDNPALNKKNEKDILLTIFAAFTIFAMVTFFKKMKDR